MGAVSPFHLLIVLVVVAIPVIIIGAIVYAVVNSNKRSPAPQPMPSAAPGWYPDPSNPHQRRWFDGVTWTDATSP
ncbi:DUF2510 domain-containing protein [Rhodococcus sp. P1Y]|nr:DUF2510 domain-containing protein [Rhodococcus sp. P1Y]